MKIKINIALILLITAAFAIGGLKTTASTENTAARPLENCIPGPLALESLKDPVEGDRYELKFVAEAGEGRDSGNWYGVFKAGKPTKPEYMATWGFLTATDCIERSYLPAGKYEAYIFDKKTLRSDKVYKPLGNSVSATFTVRPKQ
jgi:hypothetical protein